MDTTGDSDRDTGLPSSNEGSAEDSPSSHQDSPSSHQDSSQHFQQFGEEQGVSSRPVDESYTNVDVMEVRGREISYRK